VQQRCAVQLRRAEAELEERARGVEQLDEAGEDLGLVGLAPCDMRGRPQPLPNGANASGPSHRPVLGVSLIRESLRRPCERSIRSRRTIHAMEPRPRSAP